jgi:hypothetical protein
MLLSAGLTFHIEFYQLLLVGLSSAGLVWSIVKWYLEVSSKRSDLRAKESKDVLESILETLSSVKKDLFIYGEKIKTLEGDHKDLKKDLNEHKENILQIIYGNKK